MSAQKKAPLKQRDPYAFYRNAYFGCQAGEWACLAAPVIAVFGAKWNEYFQFTEDGQGVKMTIGCILALVCAAIFAYKKLKQQEKVENKHTMLSYAVGVGVAFAFSYLFKVVMDDLFLILGCEFAGAVAAYGVDFATVNNRRMMVTYRDAKIQAEAQQAAKQATKAKRGNYV